MCKSDEDINIPTVRGHILLQARLLWEQQVTQAFFHTLNTHEHVLVIHTTMCTLHGGMGDAVALTIALLNPNYSESICCF